MVRSVPAKTALGHKRTNQMLQNTAVRGTDQKPQYARAKIACAHFQIARSTLWQCTKNRKHEGFPQPMRAGPKVTLFDINAIDAFLKAHAANNGK